MTAALKSTTQPEAIGAKDVSPNGHFVQRGFEVFHCERSGQTSLTQHQRRHLARLVGDHHGCNPGC